MTFYHYVLFIFTVCLGVEDACVLQQLTEVRGQYALWEEFSPSTVWFLRLGCKSVYQLSHLTSPDSQILIGLVFSS